MSAEPARTRLLAAAERLILDAGLNAVTTRRIAAGAGLNTGLISYYFHGLDGLLRTLAELNLAAMQRGWDAGPGGGASLRHALAAYLMPMWTPAVHCPEERALALVDEMVAHGDPDLRALVTAPLLRPFAVAVEALKPLLPHLTEEELVARLRFISAGVLGMPPRAGTRQLFAAADVERAAERAIHYAMALLRAD